MKFLSGRLTNGEKQGMIVMMLIVVIIIATIWLYSYKHDSHLSTEPVPDSVLSAINKDSVSVSKKAKKKSRKKKAKSVGKNPRWTPRDPLSEPLPQHKQL